MRVLLRRLATFPQAQQPKQSVKRGRRAENILKFNVLALLTSLEKISSVSDILRAPFLDFSIPALINDQITHRNIRTPFPDHPPLDPIYHTIQL